MKSLLLRYSILFLVYLLTISSIEAQSGAPTKEQFCKYPKIHSALVIPQPNGQLKRYINRDQWLFPYIRDQNRHQIDWKNVRQISEWFPQMKNATSFRISFYYFSFGSNITSVYLMPRNNQKIFYVYSVDDLSDEPKFTFLRTVGWSQIPNEFIFWRFWTKTEWGSQTELTTMFVDWSDAGGVGWTKEKRLDSTRGGGPTVLWVSHNTAMKDMDSRLMLWANIYPNVMVFVNRFRKKYKIPIEFDAHYTTVQEESIYFKEDYACVTYGTLPGEETSADWKSTLYCKTWVDTRTIIGCFDDEVNTSGPEVIPDEPEDIDPDF